LFVIGNAWHIGAARFCNGEYAFENVVPVHYAFFDCTVCCMGDIPYSRCLPETVIKKVFTVNSWPQACW
jgi:hypothetical protein